MVLLEDVDRGYLIVMALRVLVGWVQASNLAAMVESRRMRKDTEVMAIV